MSSKGVAKKSDPETDTIRTDSTEDCHSRKSSVRMSKVELREADVTDLPDDVIPDVEDLPPPPPETPEDDRNDTLDDVMVEDVETVDNNSNDTLDSGFAEAADQAGPPEPDDVTDKDSGLPPEPEPAAAAEDGGDVSTGDPLTEEAKAPPGASTENEAEEAGEQPNGDVTGPGEEAVSAENPPCYMEGEPKPIKNWNGVICIVVFFVMVVGACIVYVAFGVLGKEDPKTTVAPPKDGAKN